MELRSETKRLCRSCWQVGAILLLALTAGNIQANPPTPPLGYEWQVVPALFDEFNGTNLDRTKWLNYHPYWTGRDSTFNTNNVWTTNGWLVLQSTATAITNVQAACVSSVSRSAVSNCYFEASVKASDISMTSSFWFQGNYSEMDVIENIGASISNNPVSTSMNMNTHYFTNGFASDLATPAIWTMPTGCQTNFHNYGLWWKDSRNLAFYHNGSNVTNLTTGGPFLENQYLFFDTEVFSWSGWPTLVSLQDPAKNKMYVDWVRTWKLVAVGGAAPGTPTGLSATVVSNLQVNLSWNVSTGAVSFNLKRATNSGGPYSIVASNLTAAVFNNTNLTSAGTYYYVVSAVNSGGESTNSTFVTATITNAQPPTVLITAPTNGAIVLQSSITTVTATITNNVAIQSGQLFVDGVPNSVDTTPPYTWTVTNLSLGTHTLAVRGLDVSGNSATNSVNITIVSSIFTAQFAGGGLQLSWNPTNWNLQTTAQLNPANWISVTGAVPPYVVATTNPQAFFRISAPAGGVTTGGLITFAEYISSPQDTQISNGIILTNGLVGITATVSGASGGFGINQGAQSPTNVAAPAFYVWGAGSGSSFVFSSPVKVPSLWTYAPSWALANDASGQQRITGKLNGTNVWAFTNTVASTSYFQITNGANKTINELVIYPKWIGVDNIVVQ